VSAPELTKEDDDRAETFGLWLCENVPRLKPFTHSEIVQRFERMLFEQRALLGEEIGRLRDALEKIEGGDGCYTPSYGDSCDMGCARVAREALASPQPPDPPKEKQ